jgi:hypothetical protein
MEYDHQLELLAKLWEVESGGEVTGDVSLSVHALRMRLEGELSMISAWFEDLGAERQSRARAFMQELSFISSNNWHSFNYRLVGKMFKEDINEDSTHHYHVTSSLESDEMAEAIARYKIAKSVHLAMDALRVYDHYVGGDADIRALVEHAKVALIACPICLPDIDTGVPRASLEGSYEHILGNTMKAYCALYCHIHI